nr:VOC family protein [uncultured Clostridium sp.]
MDGAYEHNFTYNEDISFVVSCDTQEEINFLLSKIVSQTELVILTAIAN